MRKKKHYLPLTLLVDSRNLLYKCYNGSLKTDLLHSNVNGIHYFLFKIKQILKNNLNEINHYKKVFFFFDGAASGILKTQFNPDYKKSRHGGSDHIPDGIPKTDFKKQERDLKILLKQNGFTVCTDDETEADDMIAYYVDTHPEESCHIISNDSDFFQLLNEDVSIVFSGKVMSEIKMFKKNYIFTDKSFLKKHKMHPLNIRTKKTLVGDKADEIDGVDGLSNSFFENYFLSYEPMNIERIFEISENNLKNVLSEEKKIIFANILDNKDVVHNNFLIVDLKHPMITNEAIQKIKDFPTDYISNTIRGFIKKETINFFN